MSATLLSRQFDRLVEAPRVVSRLRRLLLDLAVRGLLVPQEPGDRSANRLIADIVSSPREVPLRPTYRRLVDNPVAEPPFGIPASWAWTRLGRVSDHVQRGKSPTYSANGGPPVVSQKCVHWERLDLGPARSIKADSLGAYEPSRFLRDQDLLWNSTGTGTIGRVSRVKNPPANLICDSHVTVVRCSRLVSEYVRIWLRSDHVFGRIEGDASGSTNQVELTLQMALAMPVPLPPLAEQDRIVAKVDELMALCDEMEAAQAEREARRDRLRTTSLRNLVAPDEVKEHAGFFLRHSARMITRPEHVAGVRQAISDFAVRGRLVLQDQGDEPAAELIARISRAKKVLTDRGEIKKDKVPWDGLPTIPPNDVPEHWAWMRLQDVFEISRGGSPRPAGDPRYFGGTIPWITVREITKDREKYLTCTETRLTSAGSERSRFVNPGDLLLTNSGATLGVPKITQIRACMNDGVAVLRIFHEVDLNDFAYLYLHSQTLAFRAVNQGMGQPNLNTSIIAGWFIPIPPLLEQRRIVAKVGELMTVCDELEQSLATEQTERARLLEALLHDALEDALPARELELLGAR